MTSEDEMLETLARNGLSIASFKLIEKCHFGTYEKFVAQSPCFDKNLAAH